MHSSPDKELTFENDGYRPNVGIIILNDDSQVFWAKRVNDSGWQFPQGGIDEDESIVDGMYRELEEETGLLATDVNIVARTQDWLRYDLPDRYLGTPKFESSKVPFKGQKQVWFLLKLLNTSVEPNFELNDAPEFDDWCWIDYWDAAEKVIDFKRDVYTRALEELHPWLKLA